jgi:hypothetical protein
MAMAILENIAKKHGDETIPGEDVIDIAQACLSLFRQKKESMKTQRKRGNPR